MKRELTLRVGLTCEQSQQLLANPALTQLAKGRARKQTLRSIYFDTPDRSLRRSGMSLWLLRRGRKWRQIVNAPIDFSRGVSSAAMTEANIDGSEPELSAFEGPLAAQLRDLIGDAPLQPQFETEVRRSAHHLETRESGRVELRLDTVRVHAGTASSEFHEAEIGLISGDAGALLTVAETLFGGIAFRPVTESIAAVGDRLLHGEELSPPLPQRAAPEPLLQGQSSAEAFAAVCRSATRQILHNWDVSKETSDPEGPHQLRIGLRRMRTALRVFRPAFDSEALRQLAEEIQDLAQRVGEVRDLDVLSADIVGPVAMRNAERPGFQAVQALLMRKAASRRKRLQRELADARWSPLRLKLMVLPDGAGWADAAADKPAFERLELLAALALEECWKRAKRYGRRLGKLSVEERHELRKRLKTLRYAAEFFLSLYPDAEIARFVKRLRRLLNLFGYLNDVAMAEMLTDICRAEPQHDADRDTAAGFVLGWHSARAERAWDDAPMRWRQLKTTAQFWR